MSLKWIQNQRNWERKEERYKTRENLILSKERSRGDKNVDCLSWWRRNWRRGSEVNRIEMKKHHDKFIFSVQTSGRRWPTWVKPIKKRK
jgi:hypothetical protein